MTKKSRGLREMNEFIPLNKLDKPEEQINVYLSDGFTPKYCFNSIVGEVFIERDKVTIPKRDLKENDKR